MIEDIQTLNEWSLEGRLEVTAMSAATYPLVHERYVLLPHGASIGSGYGPIVVAREQLSLDELRDDGDRRSRRADDRVPRAEDGARRRVRAPRAAVRRDPRPRLRPGRARAGLLIHEGQLTYRDDGLEKCLDLGEWWLLETGLPLPLGVNTVRRDIGDEAVREVSAILRESIDAALEHRDEALEYALGFGRGMDAERGDRFIGMYVNELTLDYGDEGPRGGARAALARARRRRSALNGCE